MTDEHTPTTEEVRRRYWYNDDGGFVNPDEGLEFDRWLVAAHARVWAEGFAACAEWWEIHHYAAVIDEQNPYREKGNG